jgi:hypothetical protein
MVSQQLVITWETRPAPALQFIVNFGVFVGREVTRLELRRLADAMLATVPTVSIFAEQRFEVGEHTEVALHQVRIEVAHEAIPPGDEDIEALRTTLAEAIDAWAHSCVTEFAGAELTDAELAARDAVVEIAGETG